MATSNMHNLTTLIKRLEAATSRLEDIASSTVDGPPTSLPPQSSVTQHPAAADSHAPSPDELASANQAPEPLPESVEEFDLFLSTSVEKYVKLSNQFGGVVAEQAAEVLKAFQAQRHFLLLTTKTKKPGQHNTAVLQKLLDPTNKALMAVQAVKDANRASPVFTQLSAVAEGIMVLAWVTLESRPAKHVEEAFGSAQFFGNRVLKEQKDKDPKQTEWVQAFYGIFKNLLEYTKQYFPQGITWNPAGKSAEEAASTLGMEKSSTVIKSKANTPSQPPAGGLPPPPPPPGPPPVLDIKEEPPMQKAAQGGLGAVFSELNRGDAVTRGLRKVDKSEMTHKNPSLRASSTVTDASPRGKSPAPGKKPKPESMRVKKPTRKELDGNKWIIENFEGEQQPIEIEAEISHSILISRCNKATILIKGKANAVTIENSNRLSLVVESLVSTVDVVKSQNFALQVLGLIPTVMMDQIDGAQIYFSKESTATKVFTSKSSGINLNIISGPDEDYKEVPLPYQICSYYDQDKDDLVNEIVSHAG